MKMRSKYIFLSLLVSLVLTSNAQAVLTLQPLGTYSTGIFDDSAAGAVAYDCSTNQLFVTNAHDDSVDVLDISDPTNPTLLFTIDTSSYGDEPTSVAVHGGIVAVAVRNQPAVGEQAGKVAFLGTDGVFLNLLTVGFGPDNIVFTPDGTKVLVANEGRPSDNYENDPEGSISIIDISSGAASATVATANFTTFNGQEDQLRDQGIRIFGPIVQNGSIVGVASAANDLEPEYIAVSDDSTTAWITLQENNAVATLNIATATITDIKGLGFKNHQAAVNGLDPSDQDSGIDIDNWKVSGMFQPDGIDIFTIGGQSYLVTANEGNARDYSGFSEKARLKDVNVNPGFQGLQDDDKLGRLFITTEPPHGKTVIKGGEIVFNKIYSFGTRSFSIWTVSGELVYDSGDDFEQITATAFPLDFNADDINFFSSAVPDNLDRRSAEKGPEPESVVVGEIGGQTYAFIGLERIGGVMVYDVTNPFVPTFQSYYNNRDFDMPNTDAGDLGIEGLLFVSASDSPNGSPLLVTANKVSGKTTIFKVVAP
jgi:DNA-binding beta-propeller fold protein YncE